VSAVVRICVLILNRRFYCELHVYLCGDGTVAGELVLNKPIVAHGHGLRQLSACILVHAATHFIYARNLLLRMKSGVRSSFSTAYFDIDVLQVSKKESR
jgi:hypothetical protein